jgi:hypothetical protein
VRAPETGTLLDGFVGELGLAPQPLPPSRPGILPAILYRRRRYRIEVIWHEGTPPRPEALPRLGDVVQAGTDYSDPVPQIFACRR